MKQRFAPPSRKPLTDEVIRTGSREETEDLSTTLRYVLSKKHLH